jgi:hypothetical protein
MSDQPVSAELKDQRTPETRRVQFSLRTCLLAILVLSLTIANWQLLFWSANGSFHLVSAVLIALGFWLGRGFHGDDLGTTTSRARALLWLALLLAAAMAVYALWARYRWFALAEDALDPRPGPYPDEMLIEFHNWLDEKYPPPPGAIKIHGAFYTVAFLLNVSAWSASAVTAALLGMLWPTAQPVLRKVRGILPRRFIA